MSEPAEVLEPTAQPFEVFSEKPLPAGMGETVKPALPTGKARSLLNLAPRFTKENAAEKGRNGANATNAAKAAGISKLSLARANILAEQITRTHKVLKNDSLPAKDRAQLLNALDRLIERERILRGIPGPGNFRPSRGRQTPGNAPTFEE